MRQDLTKDISITLSTSPYNACRAGNPPIECNGSLFIIVKQKLCTLYYCFYKAYSLILVDSVGSARPTPTENPCETFVARLTFVDEGLDFIVCEISVATGRCKSVKLKHYNLWYLYEQNEPCSNKINWSYARPSTIRQKRSRRGYSEGRHLHVQKRHKPST